MKDQTEIGGKRPRIEGSRVQEFGSPPVHSLAYLRWKRLGAQLGLYGDSDIACFLLKYYMQTFRILPAGFTGECQTCGAPLSFSCSACDRTLSTHATHTSPLPKTSVKDAAQEEGEGRSDDDRGDDATCRPLLPKLETDVAMEGGGEGNSDDDEGDEGGSLSQYPQVSFNVGKEGGGVEDPALNLEMKPEPPWSVKEEPQDQPSAVYSTVQPLSDSTESLPSLNTSHVCQHCSASFALLSSLELHMATFHGETLHDLFLTYSAYKCYGVGYQHGSKIVNEGSYEKEKAVEGRKEKVEDSDTNWTDKRKKSRKHALVFSSREAADLFPSPDTADGSDSGVQALYLGIDTLSQVWKAADI
ncbi:hypothetical protein ACOMHN_057139 [Nucella lapillus]